jgi:seryl-tRNA synthetase
MERSAVDREALIQRGRELREARDDAANHRDDLVRKMAGMQLQIPNLTPPDVPVGGESANVVRTGALIRRGTSGFSRRTISISGRRWNLVDFEGGSRVIGHGFYFLKNQAVLLELALCSMSRRGNPTTTR